MPKLSRKFRHLLPWPFCTLLFFIGTVTAQATTYYVATTGNDSNPGTMSQPFRSIARGVSFLNAGDTLYIRDGTWTEQIDMQGPNKSGTENNYITVAGYPGETVTLRYTDGANLYGPIKARGNRGYFIFKNLVLDGVNDGNGTGWHIRDGNHHFIVQDLEIKNFKYNGIYVSGANDITIRNNRIHNQVSVCACPGERWYGLYIHDGTNIVIEENDIYNNPGGGIHGYNGGSGIITNLLIRNNKVHDNNFVASSDVGGILVYEPDPTRKVSGVRIYNNLVYRNGSAPTSGNATGIRVSLGVDGTKVWNNTVYGNKGWGISIESGTTTNTVVQNNIVYANTLGPITNIGVGTIIDHNLTTNPNFLNADALDFNVQTSSPAIDAGIFLTDVVTDLRKNRRPQGFTHDIGAYEVGAASEAPRPPQNLSVR
jgi:parallel beta-helix repeat protein